MRGNRGIGRINGSWFFKTRRQRRKKPFTLKTLSREARAFRAGVLHNLLTMDEYERAFDQDCLLIAKELNLKPMRW